MFFFTAMDARKFIANATDYVAIEALRDFTGCDDVEIERDGHCGFVVNGTCHWLDDADLVKFAETIKE